MARSPQVSPVGLLLWQASLLGDGLQKGTPGWEEMITLEDSHTQRAELQARQWIPRRS